MFHISIHHLNRFPNGHVVAKNAREPLRARLLGVHLRGEDADELRPTLLLNLFITLTNLFVTWTPILKRKLYTDRSRWLCGGGGGGGGYSFASHR